MNRSQKSKNNNRGKVKGRKIKRKLPNIPFPLLATPDLGHVFQFQAASAATELAITRQNVLSLIMVAVTAVLGYSVIGAARIKKVRIWSPIIAAFTPQTVQLEWNGGLYAPSAIHSAISEGLFPAKVETKPPKMSSPDLWSLTGASNSTETLFTVTCPAGSVIQLSLAVRLMDDEPQPTPVPLVGATVGKTYYGYLDGLPSAGILPPSGGVAIAP
jgi:hypothetical protein